MKKMNLKSISVYKNYIFIMDTKVTTTTNMSDEEFAIWFQKKSEKEFIKEMASIFNDKEMAKYLAKPEKK